VPDSPTLTQRIEELLQRVEPLLPPVGKIDWSALAFQWRRRSYLGASLGIWRRCAGSQR